MRKPNESKDKRWGFSSLLFPITSSRANVIDTGLIVQVISLNVLTYPIFEQLWEKWGTAVAIILLIIKCMIYLQTGTWFLFLHIMYYVTAFRISMLGCYLRSDSEYTEERPRFLLSGVGGNKSSDELVQLTRNKSIKDTIASFPKTSKLGDKMRKANFLLFHLCQAVGETNKVFSFPILLVITCSFITITSTLFFVIYNESVMDTVFNQVYIQLASCVLNIGIILSIFGAADLPVNEVPSTILFKSYSKHILVR